MIPGRAYWLKLGTQSVSATVQAPKYEINVNTLDHLATKTLDLNGIGVVEVSTDKPIVFEAYAANRAHGGFILIDKLTNATVAAGVLHCTLRPAPQAPCPAPRLDPDMMWDMPDPRPSRRMAHRHTGVRP